MNQKAADAPKPRWVSFASLTAALAFVLSASTVSYSVYHHARGPEIVVFPSEQVRLFGYRGDSGELEDLGVILSLEYMNSSPMVSDLVVRQFIDLSTSGSTIACLSSRAEVGFRDGPEAAERVQIGTNDVFLLSSSTKTPLPPGELTESRLVFDQRASSSDADPCFDDKRTKRFGVGDLLEIPPKKKIDLQVHIHLLHTQNVTLNCSISISDSAAKHLKAQGDLTLPCRSAKMDDGGKIDMMTRLRSTWNRLF